MATQEQLVGNEILTKLQLTSIPSTDADGNQIVGGDQKFEVKDETVRFFQQLQANNQFVILRTDGEIEFEDSESSGSPGVPK